MFENYDAFIFDMDGTLVDSGKLHEDAWIRTLTVFGIPIDRTLMRSLCGVSTLRTLLLLIERFDIQASASADEMTDYKESLVISSSAQNLKPTRLHTIVKRYSGKRLMSIGTGANTTEATTILSRCGLDNDIHYVVGADRVINPKPAPDTFLLCAELMGVAPSKCLVFEDAPLGIQAAKAANMCVIDVFKRFRIENNYFL
jgi:beta-phosphoglucomutase-like phosphatase (HAD superfamily)